MGIRLDRLGFLFVAILIFGTPFSYVFAQSAQFQVDARRVQLERELVELERQIGEQRDLLDGKKRESVSLERDIAILDAEIQKARLEIRAREISISGLGSEIAGKNQKIGGLDSKIDRERQALGAILRKTRELDSISLVELAFSKDTLTEFFSDLDNFEEIEKNLEESFSVLRETKVVTQNERDVLEEKRIDEIELKTLQELEKRRTEEKESEKENLLSITRGEEKVYEKILEGQEKTAAQIRAELFTLRGSTAIPFGEALQYANEASGETGVRPALLLGVLAEESNLGENVGTGTWTQDMHPTRDQPVFEYVTATLGLDPNIMPVSKKPGYGWGGAMGPAQFIPSTWVCYGGFINVKTGDCNNGKRSLGWDAFWAGPWRYDAGEDRIRRLVSKSSPANPWEPRDAIMASAVLLMDNGADGGTFAAERLAALRYFAGWRNATRPAYAFYGDDVMALAGKYQEQINILEGN